MPIFPRTNGPCLIRTGTGSGGSLESLGYTVHGVQISLVYHQVPVIADNGGPRIPVDYQQLGAEASISASLSLYEENVLNKLRVVTDAGTEGLLGTVGAFMGRSNYHFRLLLTSPEEDLPYNFPTVILTGMRTTLGTTQLIYHLEFRAYAYIGSGTSRYKVLYNRTAT